MSKDKKKKTKKSQEIELDLTAETVEKKNLFEPEESDSTVTVEIEEDGPFEGGSSDEDSDDGETVSDPELTKTDDSEKISAPRAKRAPAKKVVIPETTIEYFQNFPLEDIKPRERKTRYRTKDTEVVLSEMIQKFGWVTPITLDEDHRIVDGQYRYELAKKWKLETIPAVVSSGVSEDAGTTDIFHMLSGRIVEWDKWNFPETNEVLKSVDGGMGTQKVLGFETVSESGELRDLARKLGWFVQIIPKSLSGSTVTLETLAGLLKKQLAGKYQYDPAQLLYIEALREQLESVRQKMVDRGDLAGGVKEKLERHKSEEADQLKEGEAIAKAEGISLEISDDESTAVFSADREIEYVIAQMNELEASAKKQIRSAKDWAETFKQMSDGKKLGLFQFKMLAVEFDGMTPEDATNLFNSKSANDLNAIVDRILEENKTISADRSRNFPMTPEELSAENRRLKEEDARKEREKKEGPVGRKQGLDAMTLAPLRALAKLTEIKVGSMKKVELIAALRAHGVAEDGTLPSTDAENAETEEVSVEEAAVESSESDTDLEAVVREDPKGILVGEVIETEDDSESVEEEVAPIEITPWKGGSGRGTVAIFEAENLPEKVEEDIFGDDDEDLFAVDQPVEETSESFENVESAEYDADPEEDEDVESEEAEAVELEAPKKASKNSDRTRAKKAKPEDDLKSSKKRLKELKKIKAEGELSKAEKKEFKALKATLAAAAE